jgi:Leucine-rich repeat (LRR) protein
LSWVDGYLTDVQFGALGYRRSRSRKSIQEVHGVAQSKQSTQKSERVTQSINRYIVDSVTYSQRVTDKAAEQLSKVLIDSLHKLYKLNIKHCSLSGDAMAMVSSLKVITCDANQLLQICESLGLNKKLEELKMSGNVIKSKAGRALAASLDVNKTLTVLELRSCQIKKVRC